MTYLILFLGIQGIYFGMKYNGGADLRNPVWMFVSGVHGVITYGSFMAVAAIGLLYLGLLILELKPTTKFEEQVPRTPTLEEIERRRRRALEELRRQEVENKLIEEKRLLEENRKLEFIEAKMRRSAIDATRTALDDFL